MRLRPCCQAIVTTGFRAIRPPSAPAPCQDCSRRTTPKYLQSGFSCAWARDEAKGVTSLHASGTVNFSIWHYNLKGLGQHGAAGLSEVRRACPGLLFLLQHLGAAEPSLSLTCYYVGIAFSSRFSASSPYNKTVAVLVADSMLA